jgi:hypothetical protein
MAQTNLFLCDEDLEQISNELFLEGCEIVPDLEYRQSKYLQLASWPELKQIVIARQNILLFVVSSRWERSPLEMREALREGSPFYFISQKNGGPTIDVFASRSKGSSGQMVGQGFIAYHPQFWNPRSQKMEKPSKQLVSCYSNIVKRLRVSGKTIRLGTKNFLITRNSQQQDLSFAGYPNREASQGSSFRA